MKYHLLQISFWGLTLFLLTFAIYILTLPPAMADYFNAIHLQDNVTHELTQKKALEVANRKTFIALARWKQQHPNYYASIQSIHTNDALLQIVMQQAQQSGFSILQATSLNPSNYQLALSGNYFALFYFLHKLNSNVWPFVLSALTIQQINHFKLLIHVRGFHA